MTTYTVTSANVNTVLQAGAGTLVSVQLTVPPDAKSHGNKGGGRDAATGLPTANYFCLTDQPTGDRFRVLISKEEDNPALGNRQVMKINAPFSKLFCQAVPNGATYSVITA